MKTFNEFIEQKNINFLVGSIANLMVEMNINPAQYILEHSPNVELDEGFMDGLRAFKNNAWNAVKQFGSNVMKGGGIQGGYKQAMDTMAGPATKFDSAVRVLTDLANQLEKNPQTASFPSASSPGSLLHDYLKKVLSDLQKEKDNMPKMQNATVTQGMAASAAPPPGPGTGARTTP
jgi:hypothetical protein